MSIIDRLTGAESLGKQQESVANTFVKRATEALELVSLPGDGAASSAAAVLELQQAAELPAINPQLNSKLLKGERLSWIKTADSIFADSDFAADSSIKATQIDSIQFFSELGARIEKAADAAENPDAALVELEAKAVAGLYQSFDKLPKPMADFYKKLVPSLDHAYELLLSEDLKLYPSPEMKFACKRIFEQGLVLAPLIDNPQFGSGKKDYLIDGALNYLGLQEFMLNKGHSRRGFFKLAGGLLSAAAAAGTAEVVGMNVKGAIYREMAADSRKYMLERGYYKEFPSIDLNGAEVKALGVAHTKEIYKLHEEEFQQQIAEADVVMIENAMNLEYLIERATANKTDDEIAEQLPQTEFFALLVRECARQGKRIYFADPRHPNVNVAFDLQAGALPGYLVAQQASRLEGYARKADFPESKLEQRPLGKWTRRSFLAAAVGMTLATIATRLNILPNLAARSAGNDHSRIYRNTLGMPDIFANDEVDFSNVGMARGLLQLAEHNPGKKIVAVHGAAHDAMLGYALNPDILKLKEMQYALQLRLREPVSTFDYDKVTNTWKKVELTDEQQ
jgi:hypothetical protein